jgi:hypothetical protein
MSIQECLTWSLASWEEYGLGVTEKRALWKLFGSKRETAPESCPEIMAVYFFYG